MQKSYIVPLADIEMTTRLKTRMEAAKIKNTVDLSALTKSPHRMQKIAGLGRKTIREMHDILTYCGFNPAPPSVIHDDLVAFKRKAKTKPREKGTSIYLLKSDIEDLIHIFENEDIMPHVVEKLKKALPKVC